MDHTIRPIINRLRNSKGKVVRYLFTIFVQHDTHSYATICGQFVVDIYTICKIDDEMNKTKYYLKARNDLWENVKDTHV